MFRLFRRTPKPTPPPAPAKLPDADSFSDERLVATIGGTFDGQPGVVGALFLVAYEHLPIYYTAFVRAAQEDKQISPTMEGFAHFLADEHAKRASSSTEDEMNRRRYFYLYIAALLNIAHARAKERPELWDKICGIWIALLPGARCLRTTLDTTALWTPAETEFYADVKTEQDGEHYCLTMLAPAEVRFHKKIGDWLEKDLPLDIREELREMDKRFFGK